MSKTIRIAVGVILCGLFSFVLLILAVFNAVGGSSSGGGTLENGRVVNTQSDSWYLSSEFQTDTATIRTAGHTIVVAPKTLSVDGRAVADIDPATKSVTVTVANNEIEFVADQRLVATWSE